MSEVNYEAATAAGPALKIIEGARDDPGSHDGGRNSPWYKLDGTAKSPVESAARQQMLQMAISMLDESTKT